MGSKKAGLNRAQLSSRSYKTKVSYLLTLFLAIITSALSPQLGSGTPEEIIPKEPWVSETPVDQAAS